MRPIPFAILVYLFSALQIAHFGSIGGPNPYPRIEYLPLLAVFYGLYAQDPAAPLTGLVCGLLYDFLAPTTLGVFAIPLALTAYAVVQVRLNIFREHIISQFVITVLAVFAFGALAALLRWLSFCIFGGPTDAVATWAFVRHMFINALYTGAFAPAVFWLLLRFRNFLGFTTHTARSRLHNP